MTQTNLSALQMHTTQPKNKRAANQIYLVVLWAFAVCFFTCLCCERLRHLLLNWWKLFLDLLVLFLFACVFWSRSALSSLGHHTIQMKVHTIMYLKSKVKLTAFNTNVRTILKYLLYIHFEYSFKVYVCETSTIFFKVAYNKVYL